MRELQCGEPRVRAARRELEGHVPPKALGMDLLGHK